MNNQQLLPVDALIAPSPASPLAASRHSVEPAAQPAAVPYGAPQLVVHGTLESVTLQTNSTPIGGGGDF